jgi:hypothetical protein
MTQEQKDLLIKDLFTRIPYDVKVNCNDKIYNICGIQGFNICWLSNENNVNALTTAGVKYLKPYLFPLSSMTEEQYNEFFTYFHDVEMKEIETSGDYLKAAYLGEDAKRDWLNRNHFDYRYLIEKELAIDATGLNIY